MGSGGEIGDRFSIPRLYIEPQAELAHSRMGALVELLSEARRADCVYPNHPFGTHTHPDPRAGLKASTSGRAGLGNELLQLFRVGGWEFAREALAEISSRVPVERFTVGK